MENTNTNQVTVNSESADSVKKEEANVVEITVR